MANLLRLTQLILVATALVLAATGCEDDVTDLDYLQDAGGDTD